MPRATERGGSWFKPSSVWFHGLALPASGVLLGTEAVVGPVPGSQAWRVDGGPWSEWQLPPAARPENPFVGAQHLVVKCRLAHIHHLAPLEKRAFKHYNQQSRQGPARGFAAFRRRTATCCSQSQSRWKGPGGAAPLLSAALSVRALSICQTLEPPSLPLRPPSLPLVPLLCLPPRAFLALSRNFPCFRLFCSFSVCLFSSSFFSFASSLSISQKNLHKPLTPDLLPTSSHKEPIKRCYQQAPSPLFQ